MKYSIAKLKGHHKQEILLYKCNNNNKVTPNVTLPIAIQILPYC